MIRVEIQCQGVTPLLMNRLTMEGLENIRNKVKAPKGAGKPIPRDEAAPKVHQTEDGKPIIPTEALFACLVAAGQFARLDGKRQISTAKSTLLPAFLTMEDPYILLHGEKPGDKPKWEVDMRQGKNPNGGEAVAIVRPRFDKWGFKCSVIVDTHEIQMQTIRSLFDMAGRRCGLFDFRPLRKGIYGQFVITSWKEAPLFSNAAAE